MTDYSIRLTFQVDDGIEDDDLVSATVVDLIQALRHVVPYMVDNFELEFVEPGLCSDDLSDELASMSFWLDSLEGVWDMFHEDSNEGKAKYHSMKNALERAAFLVRTE